MCSLFQLYTVPEDYCGLFDKNSPIVGDIPLTASPVSSFTDLSLSAITVATTGDYTVAFLGTETGHLKKVSIHTEVIRGVLQTSFSIQNAECLNKVKLIHLSVFHHKR